MLETLNSAMKKHVNLLRSYFKNNKVQEFCRQIVIEKSRSMSVNLVPDLPGMKPMESMREFGKSIASRWNLPEHIIVMYHDKDINSIVLLGGNAMSDLAYAELPLQTQNGHLQIADVEINISNGIINPESHAVSRIYQGVYEKRNSWLIKI